MSLLVESIKQLLAPHMEEFVTRTGLTYRHILYISAGALTSVYLISKYVKARRRYSKYRLPPGPRPWPLVGNAIELSLSKMDAPAQFLHMAQTKYGPVILLNILGMEFVVLNTLEAVQEALVEKQDDFANRPVLWTSELFTKGGQDIIFGQYGPTWRFHRQIVHQAVRKIASGKLLEGVIHKAFDQVAAEIEKVDGVISMRKMVNLLVFDMMATLTFGKEYSLEDPEFKHFMKIFMEAAEVLGSGMPADFMPSLAYFPPCWPKMRAFKNFVDSFYNIVNREVSEHQSDFNPGNEPRDMTDCFLQQQAKAEQEDSSKANLLTDDHLSCTVFDVFGAGNDTVNHTISWFLIYMAKYPDIQDRVRKEVEEKWTTDVELVHLHSHLTYTQAVLQEVMRVETVIQIGIPVVTGRDTSVGGYDIPGGTMVVTNIWALHHSKEHWEDPEEFCPDRFLEKDGSIKRHAAFMPFSAGHRRCVGELLARNEMMIIIALFMRKFEWTKPPGKQEFYTKFPISIGSVPKEFSLIMNARS